MAATEHNNMSHDLLWLCTRNHSSLTVKRRAACNGGVQFSRDPLNLTNKHSKKYDGYIAPQAIGVQPGNENRGVTLLTKKAGKHHTPASSLQAATFGPNTSTRKTYRSIVNSTARRGYRPDLRREAVARASAIRKAQKPKPDNQPTKLRGARAKKAAKA